MLTTCHCPDLGSDSNWRVRTFFWTKNLRTFQGHFSYFWRTPFSAKKSLESVFFSSSTTWVILSQRSFCVCSFSLEFYISYRVSIEIQGLSSTDCNFQGLSRQEFQGACKPCDSSCRMANLLQPIRSTTRICVVMHHQFGISVLVSLMSFHGETSGGIAKRRQSVFSCYQQPQRNSIYFVMQTKFFVFWWECSNRNFCSICWNSYLTPMSGFRSHLLLKGTDLCKW